MIDEADFGPVLIEAFPACEQIARDEFIDLDGPDRDGVYIIFTVINRYLERCMSAGNMTEVARVMDFIEGLANENHSYWAGLVQIQFGEWVYSYPEKGLLENLAGPATRKAMFLAERYLIQRQRDSNASPILSFFRRLLNPKRRG